MTTTTGLDYLHLSEFLTDDERMIRDTVRQFVNDEVIPIIDDHYLAGTFPSKMVKQMGDMGF